MPRGDRTGPMGSGPMTGRRMGHCAGYTGPGFMSPEPGYRFGRGGRFGRFWGYPYPQTTPYSSLQPFNEEQERDFLDDQTKMLEDELKQIKKRQEELKKRK